MAHADSKGTKLSVKKVKGRMTVLKAVKYNGSMVYIRQFDEDIFVYDVVFKEEIYSSYLIIRPKIGKKKLTDEEVVEASNLIFQGAMTTLDMLKGKKEDNKDTVRRAQVVINIQGQEKKPN